MMPKPEKAKGAAEAAPFANRNPKISGWITNYP
jgi:hypothetical protein